jgi:hypothetical protein
MLRNALMAAQSPATVRPAQLRPQTISRRGAGISIHPLESVSLQQTLAAVESQHPRGNGTNCRHALNLAAYQHEVIGLAIHARVEETHKISVFPVDRSDINTLRLVAKHTCVAQIMGFRWPAVLLADNVIDFAAIEGVFLRDQAILAEPFGSCCHKAPQFHTYIGDRHGGYPAARRWRARALARRIKCSICRYWFNSAVSSGDKDVVF